MCSVTGDVTAVRALFRAGQTFLTWRELPPLAEVSRQVRYRVYRATRPFAIPDDLCESRVIAEVAPHSGVNLMASIDRMALSQTAAGEAYVPPRRVMFTID